MCVCVWLDNYSVAILADIFHYAISSSPPTDVIHNYLYTKLFLLLHLSKSSFRVYDAEASNTNGDAPFLGSILKKPKSAATEVFTDADAFEVDFPKDATADQKGILIGMSIFINSVFFEGDTSGNASSG